MPAAGEVEQFVYCPHNWWLARQGVDRHDEGSRRGIAEHGAVDKAHEAVERRKETYRDGLRWSFRVLGVSGSVTFLTLELVFLRAHPLHWAFLLVALIMVSASAALLSVALYSQREYKAMQQAAGIVPGRVLDRGLPGGGDPMEDPEWGVTGKPDYVIHSEDGPVPVEVKTGNTPPRPYESHRMQVAVYCRLLAAAGQTPPHGLITYPKGAFRVPWDDDVQHRLQTVLARMAAAQDAGKADRDHEHVGRCRGCARREQCEQKLA